MLYDLDAACSESHTEEAELSWLFKEYEQAKRHDAMVQSLLPDCNAGSREEKDVYSMSMLWVDVGISPFIGAMLARGHSCSRGMRTAIDVIHT